MSLEVELGVTLDKISLLLSEFGAEACLDSDGVSGNFKASNTYFVFRGCGAVNEVVAEGVDASWVVGIRGTFHCSVGSLAESAYEIKQFLIFLSEKEVCRFVLSFQYESVYVMRDRDGLHFLREMVDQ
ncbi:hypothetical protein [Pseudomonas sp. MGal98]|uniref:hypothetical protein n=1 Tax=Pseudomonas sp. MGal98 TaxID=3162460 RepID=UPI0032EF172C